MHTPFYAKLAKYQVFHFIILQYSDKPGLAGVGVMVLGM